MKNQQERLSGAKPYKKAKQTRPAPIHIRMATVSRGRGECLAQKSAYISGQMVVDERTGRVFDPCREDVAYSELIYPRGSTILAPGEVWKLAESTERRWDSMLGRIFHLAFPIELPPKSCEWVLKELAQSVVDEYDAVVETALHANEDRRQPCDGHLLVSGRQYEGASFTSKIRCLDAQQGGAAHLKRLRELFARLINEALEALGLCKRVTHLSFKEMGIERSPMLNECRGPRGDENRLLNFVRRARNERLDQLDAEIAALRAELSTIQRTERKLAIARRASEVVAAPQIAISAKVAPTRNRVEADLPLPESSASPSYGAERPASALPLRVKLAQPSEKSKRRTAGRKSLKTERFKHWKSAQRSRRMSSRAFSFAISETNLALAGASGLRGKALHFAPPSPSEPEYQTASGPTTQIYGHFSDGELDALVRRGAAGAESFKLHAELRSARIVFSLRTSPASTDLHVDERVWRQEGNDDYEPVCEDPETVLLREDKERFEAVHCLDGLSDAPTHKPHTRERPRG